MYSLESKIKSHSRPHDSQSSQIRDAGKHKHQRRTMTNTNNINSSDESETLHFVNITSKDGNITPQIRGFSANVRRDRKLKVGFEFQVQTDFEERGISSQITSNLD